MQALATRCTWLYIEVIIVGFQPSRPPVIYSPLYLPPPLPPLLLLLLLLLSGINRTTGFLFLKCFPGRGGGEAGRAVLSRPSFKRLPAFLFSIPLPPVLSFFPCGLRPSPAGLAHSRKGFGWAEEVGVAGMGVGVGGGGAETVPLHYPTNPCPLLIEKD